jgi:hypothetical protein
LSHRFATDKVNVGENQGLKFKSPQRLLQETSFGLNGYLLAGVAKIAAGSSKALDAIRREQQ